MARPVRAKKPVDYSQFGDSDNDGDDDFVSSAAPSNKRSRLSLKEGGRGSQEKPKLKRPQKEQVPQEKRVSLDDKLFQRSLEVALALSAKEPSACSAGLQESRGKGDSRFPGAEKWNDAAEQGPGQRLPHLSNCSVAGDCLGLDAITAGDGSQQQEGRAESPAPSRTLTGGGGSGGSESDFTAEDSEEEEDFSEEEDEDFSVKRNKARGRNKKSPVVKVPTEKKVGKATKSKSKVSVTVAGSEGPLSVRDPSEPMANGTRVSSEPARKPSAAPSTSPENRRPKWVPPATSGNRSHCPAPPTASVKSPSQSLRLGLSRLARVKPLHPGAASS
ncbi:RAD51-associated protein 1 isoform X1 [Ornithorhynchus anatinus]|uniref:RAD51-associated protein 1 isoform X1 n=1 Tax=Ornithorhynchus anatinus TaxID=9258 RepID=UPI0010A77060|nr:RAD51-associated protein 1 isoform X1 [Ornithorhynchus anatinus]